MVGLDWRSPAADALSLSNGGATAHLETPQARKWLGLHGLEWIVASGPSTGDMTILGLRTKSVNLGWPLFGARTGARFGAHAERENGTKECLGYLQLRERQ
jgi:hypothetical protein